MKKLLAMILIVASLVALCAMPVGAANVADPMSMKLAEAVDYCDMFYEAVDWYVVCQVNRKFVEWDYSSDEPPIVQVPAAVYEAEAAKYCVLSDELLAKIRSTENYGGPAFYDPDANVYNAFFIGGWGGALRSRFYAGYIKTGADTYDVYYENVTYEYLDEVLPEGMTTADLVGEYWPDTLEYGGHIYQSGMDGYYRVKSYDKYGVKYGVQIVDGKALLTGNTRYEVGEQPEKFDDVIAVPTVITKQPAKAYVKAGATAKFTVKATGSDLKYQWQSSTNGKTWKDCTSSTAKKATFSFTAKISHSSNYYRCKITDAAGEVTYTSAARLYVLGITSQPKTQKVEAGEKVKFTVEATGAGKTYQWQSSADGKTWKNCASSSATSATFTFTGKTSHSGNYYRCKITDAAGNTVYTETARLYVLGITSQPKTQKVEAGEKVKFTVKATGTDLKYQWQSSSDGKTWKNCASSSATSATFTFTGKTSHSGNYYRCKITDTAGNTVYTDAARLYVLGVTKQPVNKTVTKGKTVKLTVEATGASVIYQWQCSTDGGKTWKNCTSSSAKKATFTFTGKASHNGNYYRCRIKDSGGNTVYTNKVKLTVK